MDNNSNERISELFDLPVSKSPRLLWMERHHFTIIDNGEKATPRYTAIHGMTPIGYGATPDDALVAAAKSLNIKLWMEP